MIKWHMHFELPAVYVRGEHAREYAPVRLVIMQWAAEQK